MSVVVRLVGREQSEPNILLHQHTSMVWKIHTILSKGNKCLNYMRHIHPRFLTLRVVCTLLLISISVLINSFEHLISSGLFLPFG